MFMHLERYFLLLKQVFPLGCLVPKRRGESKFLQIKSRLFAALVPTFLQWYTTSITTGFWQLLSPSKNDLEICDSTFDLPKCFSSPICPSIINGVGSTNSPTITKWVMKDVRVLRNMFIGLLHFSSRNYYLGGESRLQYVWHLIESVDSDFVQTWRWSIADEINWMFAGRWNRFCRPRSVTSFTPRVTCQRQSRVELVLRSDFGL